MRDWGEQLICVRYRYNASRKMRVKTAEIVVDEAAWTRKADADYGIEIRSWEGKRAKRSWPRRQMGPGAQGMGSGEGDGGEAGASAQGETPPAAFPRAPSGREAPLRS